MLRLLDKPAILWDEVPGFIKQLLLSIGIKHEQDWLTHGELACKFCDRRDHPLNRCFKVYSTTEKGKAYAAATRSAMQAAVVQATNGDPTVANVEQPLLVALLAHGVCSLEEAPTSAFEHVCHVCEYANLVGTDELVALSHEMQVVDDWVALHESVADL